MAGTGHPSGRDDGFTVIEVVVAVALLAAVLVTAGGIFVSGVTTATGLQRRDTASQLADQALDLVRSVPAAAGTSGTVPLLQGRTQSAVTAQWAGAPAELAGTQMVWDTTATGTPTPVVPLSRSVTTGGLAYTVDTFIGRCRVDQTQASRPCTATPTTGVQYYRVVVRVAWNAGSGTSCSGTSCRYLLSTLVNGDAEPVFNSKNTVSPPVATDDCAVVLAVGGTPVVVLANDTGTLRSPPVSIFTPPSKGTATAAADGRVTYTPAIGALGTDTFVYRLSGANGAVAQATVTIRIGTGTC